MKKAMFAIALIAVLAGFAVPAQAAFQFDPGGTIRDSLKLPSKDAQSTVISVVQYILSALGVIAVILIIYGGFRYLTSAGNQEAIENARAILKTATTGLVIVIASEILFYSVYAVVIRVT